MAKHIPKSFIQELIERCDLVDLIQTRLTLKKRGTNYLALCPFHHEKTPSFNVSAKKQLYHCFGCGVSGNGLTFLMEYERLEFVEAVELLALHLGLQIPYESVQDENTHNQQKDLYHLLEKVAHFYQQQLKQHPSAINYLKQRGLTGKICKEFAVGYAPHEWDSLLKKFPKDTEGLLQAGMLIKKEHGGFYDRFRNRIMFPIRNRQGKVIGFGGRAIDNTEPKYLNSPETSIFHKSNELYGLYETQHAKQNTNHIVIVEGYLDVITLFQHEFNYAAAPLGTALTTEHLKRLTRYYKNIFLCFDGDAAGQKAAKRTLETFIPLLSSEFNIRFCLLPEDHDPDSFVRQQTSNNTFIQLLDHAVSFADFLFHHYIKINDNFDNKAHYVNTILSLIRQIPDEIYQQILLKTLANKARIDQEKLQILLKDSNQQIIPKTSNKRPSPIQMIAIMLIQHPELHQKIDDLTVISCFKTPEQAFMQEVITYIRHHPNINTAALLERFKDHINYQLMVRLATYTLSIPTEGMMAEFKGALNLIKQTQIEEQIDRLLNKASQHPLSEEEKNNLQKLLNFKIENKV
jgi:DNA primase